MHSPLLLPDFSNLAIRTIEEAQIERWPKNVIESNKCCFVGLCHGSTKTNGKLEISFTLNPNKNSILHHLHPFQIKPPSYGFIGFPTASALHGSMLHHQSSRGGFSGHAWAVSSSVLHSVQKLPLRVWWVDRPWSLKGANRILSVVSFGTQAFEMMHQRSFWHQTVKSICQLEEPDSIQSFFWLTPLSKWRCPKDQDVPRHLLLFASFRAGIGSAAPSQPEK